MWLMTNAGCDLCVDDDHEEIWMTTMTDVTSIWLMTNAGCDLFVNDDRDGMCPLCG